MKIAQIVCSYFPYQGGIGNSAERLSKLLKDEVEIDTYTTLKSKQALKNKANNVYYLKPLFKLGQAAILPGLLYKLKKYNTIIFHYPFFGSAEILWLYRLFNKKQDLIIFYHMDVKGLPKLYQLLSLSGRLAQKALIKQADLIIGSSLDYIKHSQIAKYYKKHPDKFKALSFSLEESFFSKTNPNVDENNIKLLFVGGLDREHYFKGVDNLIYALAKIKVNNWNLKIVGEGNLKEDYKKRASKLNLNHKISFIGKLENKKLKKIYQDSDLIILPSLNQNEAFGIVLIEAMANTTAVIASNLPGVRQVFSDKTGFKVEPNNIEDLSKKINIFLKNPQLLNAYKENAYHLAKDRYSNQALKKKWLEILT